MNYRIEFRDPNGKLLYDADDAPIPTPGAKVVFPRGTEYRATNRRPEYHIAKSPPHRVVIGVEKA